MNYCDSCHNCQLSVGATQMQRSSLLFHSHQDADMFLQEYGQLASSDGKDGRDNLARLLQHATAEKHSFLFINFTAPPERRFMKNFEKYLSIQDGDLPL